MIMEHKSVKILSAKQISIQNPLSEEWMENPLSYTEDYVRAVDPDFKQFISAGDARRMGKLLKRALATSLSAFLMSATFGPYSIVHMVTVSYLSIIVIQNSVCPEPATIQAISNKHQKTKKREPSFQTVAPSDSVRHCRSICLYLSLWKKKSVLNRVESTSQERSLLCAPCRSRQPRPWSGQPVRTACR